MAGTIRQWLEDLGLGQYAETFELNAIEPQHLCDVTDEDLKELGVAAMGHRKTVLRAISAMAGEAAPAPDITPSAAPGRPSAGAERRQLTVLFCDLVGSTELSTRLDPEEMRDLLRDYQVASSRVIARYEGFVAKLMGDGIYAYFGYPNAHEDDAERAVNAGLGIVEAVSQLKRGLSVRIGVATGAVAVGDLIGDGASEEVNVVGEAPNLAARLQELAEPDTVVAAEATVALAGGMFEISNLGRQSFKGFPEPVGAWSVRGTRRAASRFEARRGAKLTPLVGREEEMAILQRRWERTTAGEGQAVLISGEPGIGKSRLLEQFRSDIDSRQHELLLLQSSPYLANSALHPVVHALEETLDFANVADAEERLSRLEEWLAANDPALADATPLVADLLSIPAQERYPEVAVVADPQQRREELLAWLVRYVQVLSRRAPVVCAFEDLHWADPTTRLLVGRLVEAIDEASVLVLGTARPGFEVPWSDFPHVHLMTLSRLGRDDSRRLAASLFAPGSARETALIENIASRAGGNPLFIEELTRAVLQSGSAQGYDRAIPATLHDSLMARLDALVDGKQVAQLGSVIGREFSDDVLRKAWDGADEAFAKGLEELHGSGLIYLQADGPHGVYRFKHALVRDAAYGSMLKSQRQALHRKVLAALEKLRPETAHEVLAHHASEGLLIEEALDYWEQAGRDAAARSANLEAIEHFRHGISLIEEAGVEMPTRELALRSALGPLVASVEGDASQVAEEAFVKALALARRLESPPDIQFPLAWGLWYLHLHRGERDKVHEFADLMDQLSGASGLSGHLLETQHSVWTFNMHYGQPEIVCGSTDAGLALYDPEEHAELRYQFGFHDPKMCAHFHAAMARALRGQVQESDRQMLDSLHWAQHLEHLPTLMVARLVPLLVAFWKHDVAAIEASSQAFLDACDEAGAKWYREMGAIIDAWAEAQTSPKGGAHRRILESLDTLRATGQVLRMPMYMTALAETLLIEGHPEEALAAALQAIKSCSETGQTTYEPQARHALGVIRQSLHGDVSGSDADETAAQFGKALKSARAMGAPLLALRPAMSLAELHRDRGQGAKAYELLAPVRDRFGDSPDFPLLSRADEVLAELQ